MNTEKKIRVGISIGDLNGIGSEVILKTFSDSRMFDFCTPVVFASHKLMRFYKQQIEISTQIQIVQTLDKLHPKKLNVTSVWKEDVSVEWGKETQSSGHYALKSFQEAVKALKHNKIDVLITAPMQKSNIQTETFSFPGHTDYLNQELEGNALMLMVSENLRVGLLTDHIPVKDVSNQITSAGVTQKVKTIYQALKQDFAIQKPKIAVLSINPHAGDKGVIGTEDDTLLKPTLETLQAQGILCYGPFSADSFFGGKKHLAYDAVLAAYHDQGLIPFKTLAFGKGVNYTAGLSKVRTSPDHGTAFDIAGQNKADPNSFKEAVFEAIKIFKTRTEYLELTKNPLKPHDKNPVYKKQTRRSHN